MAGIYIAINIKGQGNMDKQLTVKMMISSLSFH